jgi:hypothetical protein
MFDDSEGAWASDEDEQGIFDDEESVFGDEGKVDTSNRALPVVADKAMHSPPVAMKKPATEKAALVAIYDKAGNPQVAKTVMRDGKPKQLEPFRQPTPDEYNSLMFNGKIVRGGVVAQEVPISTNEQAALEKTPLGGWSKTKKVAVFGGAGIAIAGAAYWYFKKRR